MEADKKPGKKIKPPLTENGFFGMGDYKKAMVMCQGQSKNICFLQSASSLSDYGKYLIFLSSAD